jgi:hypothetical protein
MLMHMSISIHFILIYLNIYFKGIIFLNDGIS